MTFSDEDLARLLEAMKVRPYVLSYLDGGQLHLGALLARLEAAEDCIGFNSRHSEWDERYKAWLRSKGEGV